MVLKRVLALLSVGLVLGVLSVGDLAITDATAQAKKEDKKTDKKAEEKKTKDDPVSKEDSWPNVKGTVAKIVKVDAAKKTVDVNIAGKVSTLTIGDDVKFLGPRGGEGDGFKDDRLVAGRNIKIVYEGMKVKEIHLDNRPKKEAPKKGDAKKEDPKKTEPKKEEKK